MQDEKIPIASVQASDFGIGVALDIEGNCRFYDLIRLRKLAKIGARVNSASNLLGDYSQIQLYVQLMMHSLELRRIRKLKPLKFQNRHFLFSLLKIQKIPSPQFKQNRMC